MKYFLAPYHLLFIPRERIDLKEVQSNGFKMSLIWVSVQEHDKKGCLIFLSLRLLVCRWCRRRPQGGFHGGPVASQRGCSRETSVGLHFYSRPLRGQGRKIGASEKPCPKQEIGGIYGWEYL